MESDVALFNLQDELLLDFEPGLTEKISQRLEKFIVADDVQVVDASPHYGLLTVQGPRAEEVVRALGLAGELPKQALAFRQITDASLGELYLVNQARLGTNGYDVFVPTAALNAAATRLIAAAKA